MERLAKEAIRKLPTAEDSSEGAARTFSCMAPLPNHRLPSVHTGEVPDTKLCLYRNTAILQSCAGGCGVKTCTFCAVIFGAQVLSGFCFVSCGALVCC